MEENRQSMYRNTPKKQVRRNKAKKRMLTILFTFIGAITLSLIIMFLPGFEAENNNTTTNENTNVVESPGENIEPNGKDIDDVRGSVTVPEPGTIPVKDSNKPDTDKEKDNSDKETSDDTKDNKPNNSDKETSGNNSDKKPNNTDKETSGSTGDKKPANSDSKPSVDNKNNDNKPNLSETGL